MTGVILIFNSANWALLSRTVLFSHGSLKSKVEYFHELMTARIQGTKVVTKFSYVQLFTTDLQLT